MIVKIISDKTVMLFIVLKTSTLPLLPGVPGFIISSPISSAAPRRPRRPALRLADAAPDLDRSNSRIQLSEFGGSKSNPGRAAVLQHVRHHCRSRDRHDPGLLCHQPSERDLSRSGPLPNRPGLYQVNQLHVVSQVLGRELGVAARRSPGAKRVFASIQPVSNWQSRGHQGTKPIPNSSQSGITSFSGSRVAIEYSFWIAVSGSAA